MTEERHPAAPRGELVLFRNEGATIKDYLQVRREDIRQLEQFKPVSPKREKGGKV